VVEIDTRGAGQRPPLFRNVYAGSAAQPQRNAPRLSISRDICRSRIVDRTLIMPDLAWIICAIAAAHAIRARRCSSAPSLPRGLAEPIRVPAFWSGRVGAVRCKEDTPDRGLNEVFAGGVPPRGAVRRLTALGTQLLLTALADAGAFCCRHAITTMSPAFIWARPTAIRPAQAHGPSCAKRGSHQNQGNRKEYLVIVFPFITKNAGSTPFLSLFPGEAARPIPGRNGFAA